MTQETLWTLLAVLMPPAAVWGAFPRRRWAAWLFTGAAAVLAAAGALALPAEFHGISAVVSAWSLSACAYAVFAVSRGSAEAEALAARVRETQARREELAKKVEASKARIHAVDTEQREVLAIYSMLKGLSEALNWEDMRPKLDMAVRQYLEVDAFALYAVDGEASGEMRLLVRRKVEGSAAASWETLSRMLQEKGLNPRVPHALTSPEGAVSVPIFEDKALVGYFYARLPQGREADRLLAKAQSFVDELTFAFRRVRLFQEVEKVSQIDGLTGVHRRGVLDEKLREELVRSQTFKTSFCLMIIDIDHFKSLNDNYGHPFGDEVLRRIGSILRESVYETDFVARYGGEEFAILLPRAEPEGVLRKAEAVRMAIEREPFEIAMQKVRVTASIGVAHFPRDGQTVEAVVRQADQALYHAKEHGRNKVVDIVKVRGES